ncbi:hypothetical protein WMF30_15340 [Sorangium sp. So ce134]
MAHLGRACRRRTIAANDQRRGELLAMLGGILSDLVERHARERA